MGATNGKNGRCAEAVKNPADEDDPFDELLEATEFARANQYCGPNAQSHKGNDRGAKFFVNDGQLLKEQVIVSHGVENARGGEDHAVGGAEGGDQDGERDKLPGPGAEHGGHRGGRNGFTGRGGYWAESP